MKPRPAALCLPAITSICRASTRTSFRAPPPASFLTRPKERSIFTTQTRTGRKSRPSKRSNRPRSLLPRQNRASRLEKAMRMKLVFYLMMVVTFSGWGVSQADDPVKKLGAFLGKWQSEATFAGSNNKITSALECRWSPQGTFLICEQLVKMPDGEHRQLTAYAYNRKDGSYSYTTVSDPGAKPTTGTLQLHRYVRLSPP